MTPDQKIAVENAKRAVALLLPDCHLVARLQKLGAEDVAVPVPKRDTLARPSTFRFHVRWVIRRPLPKGGNVWVTMWFQASQASPRWLVHDYSMHFGPTPREQDPPTGPNYYFRVCQNPQQGDGHHFHHHRFATAYDRGHIPADKSDPRIPSGVDPDWFVGVLETYLATNNVPIEVIL